MKVDFSLELSRYLAVREALGYPVYELGRLLTRFVEYLNKHCSGDVVRAHHALEWACSGIYSTSTQHVRLGAARGFLKHLKVLAPETEIPSVKLIAAVHRPEPFIFSDKQITELLIAAGKLDPRTIIAPLTFQTMLGLMACTGLRPGEVMRLELVNALLNESPARLLVHRTKFYKSRWVLLHATAVDRLRTYLQFRQKLKNARDSDLFFVSRKVKPINRLTFRRIFQHVVAQTSIQKTGNQSQPTPQSLRHSFAVHRLQNWYETGADVRALLPNLSVYLGHVDPTDSYWYLSCTPELMISAAQRFERYSERRGCNEE